MKIINQKENQIVIEATMNEELANAIRRSVYQIPTVAIHEVEISKNDSPLYDETIAHRLGLMPLKSKKFNEKKPFELTLNSKKEGFVYSEELEGDINIVYDKMPITYLKKGESIALTATTKEDIGNNHSRFSPGFIFYKNVASIKVKSDCPKEVVEICPRNVFEEDNGKVKIKDEKACNLCGLCLEYCQKQDKDFVEVVPSEDLVLTIESFGQITEKEVFEKAIEVLKKDLTEFSKQIK